MATVSQDGEAGDVAVLRAVARAAFGDDVEEREGVLVVGAPPLDVECHLSVTRRGATPWCVVSSPVPVALPEPVALAELNDLNLSALPVRGVRLASGLLVVSTELRLDRTRAEDLVERAVMVSQAVGWLVVRAEALGRPPRG